MNRRACRSKPLHDAVGELLSLINGYNYVGGNPVNRIDPSGMCWLNSGTSPEQQSQCTDVWFAYTDQINQTYTTNWPQEIRTLVTQEAYYWGNLSHPEFANQWNSSRPPASTDPGGEVLSSYIQIGGGISILNPAPGPEDLVVIGGLCIAAIWAIAANASRISLPMRQQIVFDSSIIEYKLKGFDRKVGTLAEHLAKLLEHDVAGYPPSDPNPYRDPDGGWCQTIRRVIKEIDNAGYSRKQLERDLVAAGFQSSWDEIRDAVTEVVERGLCDDHWGDFGGGSLVTG